MFRTLANMRAKRHGQTDDAPHLAVKTASLAPFHRDFAPPHIISYVGPNIAYYIGMSGTQTKTEGGEMSGMSESKVAEMIIEALTNHDVAPDAEHEAAGGRDWGYVRAWNIDERLGGGTVAIAYGDNGGTRYALADDYDDLPIWLIQDDADAVDICNARDDDPDEVAEDYAGQCRIILHGNYYHPGGRYEWVTEYSDYEAKVFETREAAQDWIDDADSGVYVTEHNEAGRPDYYIVEA